MLLNSSITSWTDEFVAFDADLVFSCMFFLSRMDIASSVCTHTQDGLAKTLQLWSQRQKTPPSFRVFVSIQPSTFQLKFAIYDTSLTFIFIRFALSSSSAIALIPVCIQIKKID